MQTRSSATRVTISQLDAARRAARRASPSSLVDLRELVRIRSVSGTAAHRSEVGRAAVWLARWLRRRTPSVHLVDGPAGPVVLARLRGRRPGSPAVCLYGHLDVRPPGTGWTVPPFAATVAADRLVARGASDDKGQLMAQLAAFDAWAGVGGAPSDLVVVAEAAEEIGSPGLSPVLRRWRRQPVLAGRMGTVVVADTRCAAPGVPSLTTSQRGSLMLRVVVDVGGAAVHAGRFGGAVLDPNLLLADALLRLRREVSTWRPRCDAGPGDLSEHAVRVAAGGRATHRAGDLSRRTTRRGAVSVSAWHGGGARGSIPSTASALLDVRLPPGMDADQAAAQARRALRGRSSCLESAVLARSRGDCLQLPSAVHESVRQACRAGFGCAPVVLASGGSQPAVTVLAEVLRAPVVLLGLGPHDDGAHGPDEHLDLVDWTRAIDTCVCLLGRLGRQCRDGV